MRGMTAYIYKSKFGDSSNGGLSSKYDEVVFECEDGYLELDPNNLPDNFVVVRRRDLGFCKTVEFVPKKLADKGAWAMFGGCYVSVSDSRFSRVLGTDIVKLFDRVESAEDMKYMD